MCLFRFMSLPPLASAASERGPIAGEPIDDERAQAIGPQPQLTSLGTHILGMTDASSPGIAMQE